MAPGMMHVDQLMQRAIEERIFPGAVLAVVQADRLVFEGAYGAANVFSGVPMKRNTVFDLASLTKPLATVMAVMALVRNGRIDLEQTCVDFLPELVGGDKAAISIRQLLTHRAGFPAWRPYYMHLLRIRGSCRYAVLKQLLAQEPLIFLPGQRSEYSDLGFMMLQWVLETICGMGLDVFVERHVYGPLNIDSLVFNPMNRGIDDPSRFAATQLCPWRCKLVVGCVDDDNAAILGGVGGHAGLFGTAHAVVQLLRILLASDQQGLTNGIVEPALLRDFWHSREEDRWALGFDTPSRVDSSAGRHFPRDSVGHLGFTGTSFWIHRNRQIIVVLLTNRVHPFRFRSGIRDFRPKLHDAIMEAL